MDGEREDCSIAYVMLVMVLVAVVTVVVVVQERERERRTSREVEVDDLSGFCSPFTQWQRRSSTCHDRSRSSCFVAVRPSVIGSSLVKFFRRGLELCLVLFLYPIFISEFTGRSQCDL